MKPLRSTFSLLVLVVVLAAAVLAGCGSGSAGDPDADPSAVVPARAPVYIEATLKPDGELADNVRTLSKKLFGTDDPGAELRRLLDASMKKDDPKASFEKDIEPWLGDRVALFATSIRVAGTSDASADAAIVATTKDADKAAEALAREMKTKRTYRDVEMRVDPKDDSAGAVVGDYVVVGNQAGVRAAIDAKAGQALSDAESFQQARDQVENKGLGFGYVRLSTLLASLGPQGAAFRQLLGQTGDTVAMALDADSDAIRVETAALGATGQGGSTGDATMVASLPDDAWAAVGIADIGGQLERALRQFSTLGALGGFDVDQMLGQVRRQTGIDVRRDLLDWMGDGAIFVRGKELSDIGGALVVRTKDPARAARVLPRIARLAAAAGNARVRQLRHAGVDAGVTLVPSGMPLPVHLAVAGDRFIVAVTDAALEDVLKPSGKLGDSAGFKAAAAKLEDGIAPSLFLDFAPVRSLIDATGATSGNAGAARVRRALDALTTAAAGGKREDGVQRGRFVVGVS